MNDAPVIDETTLMAQFENDQELLIEVAELFLADYPRQLDAIRQGIAERSATDVEIAAHTLKGAVSNFAASPARKAAAELERIGREQSLAEADEAYRMLLAEMRRLDGALRGLISQAA